MADGSKGELSLPGCPFSLAIVDGSKGELSESGCPFSLAIADGSKGELSESGCRCSEEMANESEDLPFLLGCQRSHEWSDATVMMNGATTAVGGSSMRHSYWGFVCSALTQGMCQVASLCLLSWDSVALGLGLHSTTSLSERPLSLDI